MASMMVGYLFSVYENSPLFIKYAQIMLKTLKSSLNLSIDWENMLKSLLVMI